MIDTLNPLRNCDGVDSESQLIKLELLNFWLQITKTSKSDCWRGCATAFFGRVLCAMANRQIARSPRKLMKNQAWANQLLSALDDLQSL
jgi:hypothetical protein